MAAPKRSPFEIARDRAEIAHLYLTRVPQAEIADRLSKARGYTLTQQMVSYDLQAVYKLWRQSAVRDFNEDKARELARIDALELECWEAWRESKKPRKVETTQQRQADSTSLTVTIRTERTEGNPAFLAGVQWCIGKRIEILGLAAPVKIAPTDPSGEKPYESLTDAERIDRLVALVDAARARRDGSAPGDGPAGPVSEIPGEVSE